MGIYRVHQIMLPCSIVYMHAAPSGQPQNVSVESASYSWMSIQWQAPYNIGSHGISYYNVTVYNVSLLNDMVMLISETSTENNETRANITGLQPGMSIQIQVAGITRVGNLIAQGPYSNSFQYNTSIAGKNDIGVGMSYDVMLGGCM